MERSRASELAASKMPSDGLPDQKRELDDEIRKWFSYGKSHRQLAVRYGMNIREVESICREVGRIDESANVIIARRNAAIRAAYANGSSVSELVIDFALDKSYIEQVVRNTERKRQRKESAGDEDLREQILEGFKSGKSYRILQREFNCSANVVASVCKGVEREREFDNPKIALRNDRIRDRFANGASVPELIEEFALGRDYVAWVCRGMEKSRIIEAFASGKSHRQIAADFGICTGEVANATKGIERKKEEEHPEIAERNCRIRDEYAGGAKFMDIKRRYGLSTVYLAEVLKDIAQDLVIEAFADGKSQRQIAADFGICASEVAQITKGTERKKERDHPEIAKRNSEIRKRHADGERFMELKREYGLSTGYLSNLLEGVVQGSVVEAFADGMTYKAIQRKFRLNPAEIAKICKGVQRRSENDYPHLAKRNEDIRRKHAEGAAISELGLEYGLALTELRKICKN